MRDGGANAAIQSRKSLARAPIKTQPIAEGVQAGSRIRQNVRLNRPKARARRWRRGMRWGRARKTRHHKFT